MGLFDRLTFEDGLDIEFPDIGADPYEITWQTKTVQHHPAMENYKISADGRLYKEVAEWYTVPEEERPRYDEEIGGFEREFDKGAGMIEKEHHGWSNTEYHGTFEFHASIEGNYVSLEAKLTDGQLVEINHGD
ncbi:hypothetical protein [Halomicrobium salinisoli]|uniref:hypothetical protein n=1 Tax=Halomicrobium salinisoli TaxID=2878391 RepID=UPI001CEFB594|nr:hypothetical protein [Halomicrobium salinisoli]